MRGVVVRGRGGVRGVVVRGGGVRGVVVRGGDGVSGEGGEVV